MSTATKHKQRSKKTYNKKNFSHIFIAFERKSAKRRTKKSYEKQTLKSTIKNWFQSRDIKRSNKKLAKKQKRG